MKHPIILLLLGSFLVKGMTTGLPLGVSQSVTSNEVEETTVAIRTNGCRLVTRCYLRENKVLKGTWRQELWLEAVPLIRVERMPVTKMLAITLIPISSSNRVVQIDFDSDGQMDSYLVLNGEKVIDVLIAMTGSKLRHATPEEWRVRWRALDVLGHSREQK